MSLTIAYNSNHLYLSLLGHDLTYSKQQDHVGSRDFFFVSFWLLRAQCRSSSLSHGVTEIKVIYL